MSIIGRVLSSTDYSAVIQTSDSQQVRINLIANGFALPPNTIIEFVGKINPDNTITEISRIALSGTFDLDAYEGLIKKMQKPELRSIFI